MTIAVAADHAGYALKENLSERLRAAGHLVLDYGTFNETSCDYPDFAFAAADAVTAGRADRAFLVCTTGMGMMIAANKVSGIRAVLATTLDVVRLTREHNDANVLAFGASQTTPEDAWTMAQAFLDTPFSRGERHARRLTKLSALEGAVHKEQATVS